GCGGSLRKVLIGFPVLLALVAAALAAAPVLVDPEAYRGIVTASLRDALGHEVAIDGPLELTLLPRPSLAARDLRIANPRGSAEPVLPRVGGMELRLAVAPLLAGRLVFAGVTMADPILDLERRSDGRLNLEVPSSAAGNVPVADNVRGIA